MNNRKVVVIGLDGADWRLLRPWIHNHELPTLARLVSEGTSGPLRSTIRPESSVAWSSFSTGVNPGKHGVFGFAERLEQSYTFGLANASSVRARRFWDFLGDQGYRVGLMNIPFTYPPSPVHGFLISGMLTPGADVEFTHPPELRTRLLERFEPYLLDGGDITENKADLIEHVHAYTLQQRDMALWLLQEQPWDVFSMVFTGPDRLQHFLWDDMDPGHPFHDAQGEDGNPYGDALLAHYKVLDGALREILDALPENALILLISDHGFNGFARKFYVNHWLHERGYLRVKRRTDLEAGVKSVLSRLKSIPWIRRLKRAVLPKRWNSFSLRSMAVSNAIDWSQTQAFFGLDGGVRINLEGREPEGIVPPRDYDRIREELQDKFLNLVNPETTRCPISEAFFREEIYRGPFVDQAPDLILEPERDNDVAAYNFLLDGSLGGDLSELFDTSAPYSANHALDGILIAWGAEVAQGQQIGGSEITDLAPTILAYLGVSVPRTMDGNVLQGLFSSKDMVVPRYMEDTTSSPASAETKRFGPEEEKRVEERLKKLGYLD